MIFSPKFCRNIFCTIKVPSNVCGWNHIGESQEHILPVRVHSWIQIKAFARSIPLPGPLLLYVLFLWPMWAHVFSVVASLLTQKRKETRAARTRRTCRLVFLEYELLSRFWTWKWRTNWGFRMWHNLTARRTHRVGRLTKISQTLS